MAKVALLIGVSEYEPGLNPLPASVRDMEAIAKVLQHPEMGDFAETDIQKLENPDPQKMQEAMETLFSDRRKDDLVVLYFSGHGIKDESGNLYLATCLTRKNPQGQIIKSTSVPASFIHNIMSDSHCKRQVIILDCCYSGAFAQGWSAKDDGSIDIQTQLGGEGRVVLTSSTATEYSFQQQEENLSIYTRYLIEGIETGAADLGNDGAISVDELHEYAKKKVKEAAPAMKPEIYAFKEGFKILLAKAPIGDPKLRYRKEVEIYASRGEISIIGRRILDALRQNLGLLPEETAAIEAEVLKPYREYKQKLQEYEQALVDAIGREQTLSDYTRNDLRRYQGVLGLRDEDINLIKAPIIQVKQPNIKINPIKIKSGTIGYLLIGIVLSFCIAAIIPSPVQSYLFTIFIDSRKRDKSFSDLPTNRVPEGTFKYGGSTSWAPIYQKLEAEIERDWPNLKLEYDNSLTAKEVGSAVGIQKVINGELAFALSSRSILDTELQEAKNKGFSLKEISVAKDAVAVAVNLQLNVRGLTKENLKSIYTGEIDNWKEFGGPDIKITVYSRNDNSGTTVQFKEILEIQEFGNNVKFINTTTEALQKVAGDISGIYYASASEIVPQCTVKSLPIINDKGKTIYPYQQENFASPAQCVAGKRNRVNIEAMYSSEYSLPANLYVVVKQNSQIEQQAGQAYANLLLTKQGQEMIRSLQETGNIGSSVHFMESNNK